jgi:hypothetical protein
MKRSIILLVAASLMIAAACGGGGGTTNPNPNPGVTGKGTMSAKVDGTAWASLVVITQKSPFGANTLVVASGADVAGHSLAISFFLTGTGTQKIGLQGMAGLVTNLVWTGGQYQTSPGVGSGSITLSTQTATRAVGTFTFTAVGSGNTPPSRVVTEGRFDVNF